jgi:hypothetical protein
MQLTFSESIRVFVNRRILGAASKQKTGSRRDLAPTALFRVALLCLAAYCVLGAVLTTVGSSKLILNQRDNTYPESTNIYDAINAVRTGHLYSPLSQPPYVLQPYGPLYYLINATIAWASHLEFDLVRVRVRLLTFCCFLLSAVIIFLICRRLHCSTVNSALAALMLLGEPYFLSWNVTVRPDMLFLMVMLLSLLWAVKGDALGGKAYIVSGTMAGLAFLIKQPGIAAPIAVLTVLLCRKQLKSAFVYALSAGLPVVLVVGVLLWHRGPFVEQFTSVGKGIWSLQQGALFAFDKLSDITMLTPMIIGGIGFTQAIRGDTASQMIATFALANWVVGLSGLPQIGADSNYFLPGLAGCALLLPFAIQMIREVLRMKVAFVLIIVWLLWTMSKQENRARWVFSAHFQQPEISYADFGPLKILSDRPVFTVHGRDPDLLDPFTSHELELAHNWDSSPIVENVRRGDYDLVILAGSWTPHLVSQFRGVAYFSPALVKAINENYSVLCSTMTSAVLKPRVRDVDIAPAVFGLALGEPCGLGEHGRSPDLMLPPDTR